MDQKQNNEENDLSEAEKQNQRLPWWVKFMVHGNGFYLSEKERKDHSLNESTRRTLLLSLLLLLILVLTVFILLAIFL